MFHIGSKVNDCRLEELFLILEGIFLQVKYILAFYFLIWSKVTSQERNQWRKNFDPKKSQEIPGGAEEKCFSLLRHI